MSHYDCKKCGKYYDCKCDEVEVAKFIGSEQQKAPAGTIRWPHKPPESSDAVNNPSHYASGDIECIDAIEASMSREAFCGYLKGNVQKYMWRYEKKINPVEDLKKAQWYQNRLIQTLEKQ